MIRGGDKSSSDFRCLAIEMLANATYRGGHEAILSSEQCMVACTGAFCCTHGDVMSIHDACAVLCVAAKREAWGPCLNLNLVMERLGFKLFCLCCTLNEPEIIRTQGEELLVTRLFELAWHLRNHRRCEAFDKLRNLDGRKCVLTAAISYLYDKRSKDSRHLRHYREGAFSDLHPSGLDCCLRAMEGMAIHDMYDPKFISRNERIKEAAQDLRSSKTLHNDEKISCEILFVISLHATRRLTGASS